jgi:hypothetical protein
VLWIANLTGDRQSVKVSGFKGAAQLHVLDEKSFDTLIRHPDFLTKAGTHVKKVAGVEIGPYAIIRITAA